MAKIKNPRAGAGKVMGDASSIEERNSSEVVEVQLDVALTDNGLTIVDESPDVRKWDESVTKNERDPITIGWPHVVLWKMTRVVKLR